MNIHELRLGNLMRWKQTGEIVTVTGVFEDKQEITARKANGQNVEDIVDAFEPIDISVDLLIRRANFYQEFRNFYDENSRVNIVMGDTGVWTVAYRGRNVVLKWVHELQNIYYWLSNKEELNITQPL